MKLNKKLATAALTGILAAGGLAACATEGEKDSNSCNSCKDKSEGHGCEGNSCKDANSCKDKNGCEGNSCSH